LNERKAEVRIQFNDVPGQLFPGSPRNELVIKIQPNESTYLKMQVKAPGLAIGTEQAELELHYPTRYSGQYSVQGASLPFLLLHFYFYFFTWIFTEFSLNFCMIQIFFLN